MRAAANPIREGAEGFLLVQYTAIARIAVILSVLITLSYMLRPPGKHQHGIEKLGNGMLGLLGSTSFILVSDSRRRRRRSTGGSNDGDDDDHDNDVLAVKHVCIVLTTVLLLLLLLLRLQGALCSAAAGYLSMWVAAQTNIRVCSAAR